MDKAIADKITDPMTTDDWVATVKSIDDPTQLLWVLVELDADIRGIGDPYYRELYQAIIDRAAELARVNA